jgi:HK97 family phage prohead protease
MTDKTQRAYSVLEIKAMDETDGKRTFKGVATTPTPDRVGDIVEPKGAEFQLPIPLLWQHNSREPIGWVRAARVTDKGIEVECEIASVPEAGKLKDRLDEAWQSLKSKLVGGLSIGFKPLESARIGESYSYRFMKWLWLELSAVTVPANGDCSITAIKSADEAIRRAASGAKAGARVVRLDTVAKAATPGASGTQKARRSGVVYLN